MNMRHIARALGGDVAGRDRVLCPGPGHSARDRSLSVTFRSDGFLVHSFAGDDWQACRDHVSTRLNMPFRNYTECLDRRAPARAAAVDMDATSRALDIWRETVPLRGTPGAIHLERRGVAYDGDALRWHSSAPFGRGVRHGCMVALVRNIVTNEPQAIHRTAIDASGRKIDRKALGPIAGGAVKLTENEDVTTVLAIAEGIETALSLRTLPDLECMPIWSLISAGGIANFPLLAGVEALWVGADHDPAGIGAARKAAKTWLDANREVLIVHPNERGADLNDLIVGAANA